MQIVERSTWLNGEKVVTCVRQERNSAGYILQMCVQPLQHMALGAVVALFLS